ncbi:GrlR family regulatory protein [Acinetobacter sp. FDAARGOS_541]|uniref:GrlR family regulatory protein n=1 Tax=Acinetobacter sp. FDAARGOS_541 TaxID=2420312 RepID=UPI001E5B1241|nr:GrlR family regulatory protein [Acinetobacter sp. FDAARGOS_541]
MRDGIYFVKFKSTIQDFGEGTVVVKDGVVNGGDYGFTYRGRVENNLLKLNANNMIGMLYLYLVISVITN